jgi:2-haloacid dehalogenase
MDEMTATWSLREAWLVAAHGWDLAGAAAVGCRTAFLARPGNALDPLRLPPTLVVEDVKMFAGRLLDRFVPET